MRHIEEDDTLRVLGIRVLNESRMIGGSELYRYAVGQIRPVVANRGSVHRQARLLVRSIVKDIDTGDSCKRHVSDNAVL